MGMRTAKHRPECLSHSAQRAISTFCTLAFILAATPRTVKGYPRARPERRASLTHTSVAHRTARTEAKAWLAQASQTSNREERRQRTRSTY